jgi:hypothetical protein
MARAEMSFTTATDLDGNTTPLPGDVDMSRAGTGAAGDFGGE